MAKAIHVEVRAPRFQADQVRVEGLVRGHSRWRHRNGVVFFEVPAAMRDSLAIQGRPDDLRDAFLRARMRQDQKDTFQCRLGPISFGITPRQTLLYRLQLVDSFESSGFSNTRRPALRSLLIHPCV